MSIRAVQSSSALPAANSNVCRSILDSAGRYVDKTESLRWKVYEAAKKQYQALPLTQRSMSYPVFIGQLVQVLKV